MPALHALGQHPALQAAHNHLREETLVAFLDNVEVGGRWGSEAASFLRLLARARARAAPEALRPALRSAYVHRAIAAQRALAATLAGLPSAGQDALDGAAPPLPEVLAAARHGAAEAASRLPLRPG